MRISVAEGFGSAAAWWLVAALLGCSSGGGKPNAAGGASGGGQDAGVDSAGAGGAGPRGGVGGAPADAAVGGGTGGRGGSGGQPTDARPADANAAITCGSHQQRLVGTLAGDAIALDVTGRVVDVGKSPWLLLGLADQGELFALQGLTNGAPLSYLADPSNQLSFYGLLALPRAAPGNGRVYCLGAGRVSGSSYTARVTVDSAAVLGQCPGGTPVAGQLEFCTSGLGACHSITGTLDGVTIQVDGFTNATSFNEYMAYQGNLAIRFLMTDGQPVSNGLVWSPSDGLLGGAVYCIGAGSCRYENPDGSIETISHCTLNQFTKVGTCASGAGTAATASGCVRGAF